MSLSGPEEIDLFDIVLLLQPLNGDVTGETACWLVRPLLASAHVVRSGF